MIPGIIATAAAAECCRSDRRPTAELRKRLVRQAAGLRRSEELPYPRPGRRCQLKSGALAYVLLFSVLS